MTHTTSVWITRPEPGNAATARRLQQAGFQAISVPVLDVAYESPPATALSAPPRCVVFVSANAVRGLEHVWPEAMSRHKVRAYAVGEQTARALHRTGWSDIRIAKDQTADGLLALIAQEQLDGATVWIPSGNRMGSAREVIPRTLAERGAEVEVFPVYRVEDRDLALDELALLSAATPEAIVYHSPSAVNAVFSSAVSVVTQTREQAWSLSIGPATSAALHEAGAGEVVECTSPNDDAVVQALEQRIQR